MCSSALLGVLCLNINKLGFNLGQKSTEHVITMECAAHQIHHLREKCVKICDMSVSLLTSILTWYIQKYTNQSLTYIHLSSLEMWNSGNMPIILQLSCMYLNLVVWKCENLEIVKGYGFNFGSQHSIFFVAHCHASSTSFSKEKSLIYQTLLFCSISKQKHRR